MTAKYWTKDGEVMCRLVVKTVFEFTNLDTDEVVTLDNMHDIIDTGFLPVPMPKVKKQKVKKEKVEKEPTATKSSRRGPRKAKSSKYKGVSTASGGKWRAQVWDKRLNTNVGLGTFDSEMLAATAYQEHIGNHKEARRRRNEHEEGDPAVRPMEQ